MELVSVLYKVNIKLTVPGLLFSAIWTLFLDLFLFANLLLLMTLVMISSGYESKTVNYLSLIDGGQVMPGNTKSGAPCRKVWINAWSSG